MNNLIYEEIKHATKLDHIRVGLIRVFESVQHFESQKRIGIVSGIVSSDGDENIEKNVRRLDKFTVAVRKKIGIPTFSTADVFGKEMYNKIEEFRIEKELREQRFRRFWEIVLQSGHITDIFMTPGWERSTGATEEHKIAKKLGIKVHYINKSIWEQ